MMSGQANRQAAQRVLARIDELNLQSNLLELQNQGYTVLPNVLDERTIARARDAILSRVEGDVGRKIDLNTATEHSFEGMTYVPYLLYDDEVFEEVLMQPEPLALITYLLGESALLSSMGCHFKGPGGSPLALHSDNGNGMPSPFPSYSQVANVNYALTPYSQEAGALALVPGSHLLARQPTARETRLEQTDHNRDAQRMDLAPGDAVVWHGNTWHGSFARTIPGIRMNLAVYFARQYVQTQERHQGIVPSEVLARHADDERFNILLGAKQPYGWQKSGPNYSTMANNPSGLFD